uniref:Replication protein A C-terminal domain-containing protein n=1 Tax=Paramoeba aestuarina TaxID=180227 RepID=A0A7S4NUL7_9EUKA|mmetsp:Transcript_29085/g.44992  ORF Transcript_29085/g.44992 Transcript_29085/m.44992 type:complete len:249 (+) Transcript_29085:26-772(+)|eukprot:CAMPEP_0201523018 /NCGR_PEP_ID=MMETSP0161_2-20130828/18697_1 /ASSEMBLY_ACC=CAM_ASM_000251 /TAXON_ID=180227 /ORGANISM="Neoparamoeba aestuarina, Strain SoJaBio B1-5/56/2" /LENGTH=248 /DNA_ID=CAMNT_0047922007 /DNA_START=22 /DNA_END=768 /DNA_ORIENTATION=+
MLDAESLAGVGGFVSSQEASPTKYDQQGTKGNFALRPLTIKQIVDSHHVGDGVMIVDGREVGQVTVVGRIIGFPDGPHVPGIAKMFPITISDDTGSITCKKWIDAGEIADPGWEMGSFIRVFGAAKMYNDQPQVTGQFRRVFDSNEVIYHHLECILMHLRLTRPVPERPQVTKDAASPAPAGASLQELIRYYARNANKKTGTTWEEVYEQIKRDRRGSFSAVEVQREVSMMLHQGSLVTTIDEEHFLC